MDGWICTYYVRMQILYSNNFAPIHVLAYYTTSISVLCGWFDCVRYSSMHAVWFLFDIIATFSRQQRKGNCVECGARREEIKLDFKPQFSNWKWKCNFRSYFASIACSRFLFRSTIDSSATTRRGLQRSNGNGSGGCGTRSFRHSRRRTYV